MRKVKYERRKSIMKEITAFEKEQCKTCKFRTWIDSTTIACNYLACMGKRRPSPVGEPCKEYEAGKALKTPPLSLKRE